MPGGLQLLPDTEPNRNTMKNKPLHWALWMLPLLLLYQPTRKSKKTAVSGGKKDAISQCSIQNFSFQDGETITYKLYYNWNFVWMSAGEVTFRVKEMKDQYHLSAHGATYKSYEWFFKVRDRYDTYVDKETLLPKVSIRDVQEGKFTLYDKVVFDQNQYKARSLRGDNRRKAKLSEYELGSCMHDILSIVYYTRNVDCQSLEPGQHLPVRIFMDKEVWPLKVTYKGVDGNKKIKGQGRYNTIVFSPDLIEGEYFKEGDEMLVWVSNDDNRLPLLIESPVSVGSVKAVLKEYDGLRHPLKAKR